MEREWKECSCGCEIIERRTARHLFKYCSKCYRSDYIRPNTGCCWDGEMIPARRRKNNGQLMVQMYCTGCGVFRGGQLKNSAYRLDSLPILEPKEFKRDDSSEMFAWLRQKRNEAYWEGYHDWWRDYNIYMSSAEWRAKADSILERDKYLCQHCLIAPATQVHHLSYKNFRREPDSDLLSLCKPCHDKIPNSHNNGWGTPSQEIENE